MLPSRFLMRMLLALAFPATAMAQGGPPLIIGQTYIGTGPIASLSTDPLVGIKAALNEVNTSGGVGGRRVVLKQMDDGADAARAEKNVHQLVDEGALAILMPLSFQSSLGATKAGNELKVPVVGAYTGNPTVLKFSEYGFPVRISFDEEYGRIVNHLFTVGITNIAFAYNDNPGAKATMETTKKLIEQRGQKLVADVPLAQNGSDTQAKAAELAKLRPSAVVFSTTNELTGKFIQAYRATGARTSFYSFSFVNGRLLYQSIGADAVGVVVSQVVPNPWAKVNPVVADYQAAMKKIGETELSYGGLEGYLSTKVLIEGLKRAGPNPTPRILKKALEFGSLDMGGVHVQYTATEHPGLSFSELSMVRADGSYAR